MTLWKDTLALRAFGLIKIPLLFFVSPTIVKLNEKECEVKIPLNWVTKNHLNSMYFGVLAMGADCGGGLLGMEAIRRFAGPDVEKSVYYPEDDAFLLGKEPTVKHYRIGAGYLPKLDEMRVPAAATPGV